ncbi:hypothetical protein Rhopal_003233-T1 [Rhodotorula paludigena]|uniref:Aminotransferase class I/classII large domain-containing protein n=1 Tax=Rhodotorula paludigena TaxID=86838 RepID=A0AAV5GIE3_9BASI|nr:hypothetical protein Rhopal_003233-T1 [Rhodotorula paludigena]
MQLHVPGLSERATKQLDETSKSPLFSAIFRTFGNQASLISPLRRRLRTAAYWSEENPDGVVNAGLAENSLLHDWLIKFWERQGTLKIGHTDLTYGTSILGSSRIFSALGEHYQRYFAPHVPVAEKHIATSNGLSPMIEHIAAVISDPGDQWLLPAPWYNGFVPDLNAASQVGIASVSIPAGKNGTLAEVEAMHAEMERRAGDKSAPKITAVLVTNPHNPLGFCYTREVLIEYCKFADKWNLYLVSDEIYALSVFDADHSAEVAPFTSILSIDAVREAGCSPARIIQLYGASKDFGANGIRAGNAVCQHNDKFMSALASTAMPMRMGSPTDILWSALLTSPDLEEYLSLNRRALSRAYAYLTAWLRAQDLPYTPANAGHFVLVDYRKHVDKVEPDDNTWENVEDKFIKEIAFLNKLVDAGVYCGPGRKEIEVALERIEQLCGMPAKAKELSGQYPP